MLIWKKKSLLDNYVDVDNRMFVIHPFYATATWNPFKIDLLALEPYCIILLLSCRGVQYLNGELSIIFKDLMLNTEISEVNKILKKTFHTINSKVINSLKKSYNGCHWKKLYLILTHALRHHHFARTWAIIQRRCWKVQRSKVAIMVTKIA